ncbi:MAG: HAMP domain-containing sensor histidine kinase [Balneolaceae bacterium]
MAFINKNISKQADIRSLFPVNGESVNADRLFISKKFQSISYKGVEEILTHMNNRIHANSSGVYLIMERDECVAHRGSQTQTYRLNQEERLYLMSGRGFKWGNGLALPLILNHCVIGYILVEGELTEDEKFTREVGKLYSELILKEMQLEYNRGKVEYYSHNLIHEKKESKKKAHRDSIVMDMAVHDISSPLSAIHGYLEMIEKNLNKNQNLGTIKKYYERISIGVQDITEILTQFEDLKNIKDQSDDLNLILINLNWLISDIAKLYKLKAKKLDIKLSCKLPDKPVYVRSDVSRMKRAVINLVENAIKYSNTEGYVKIELEADEAHAKLHIIDNGIGISEDKQKDIFKPFFQVSKEANRNNPGSVGLGLYIATNFINQMNGHIDMKSREGEGSRFSIYVPCIQKEEF